ncbi:hypothetical protein MY04_3215 [Flammeovirga sp. MY04]|uniref:energy transducer TonB n=1 Tax=Flammeovirga sp. MY04 TaxID=1191459 RepID=UPI0008063ABF|nr:energy transducer TonB [Flammeovirga sp. MY04]ANQ50580.1 hypothetical protein MY04_3215 [Flammeovirga sp. MY04]
MLKNILIYIFFWGIITNISSCDGSQTDQEIIPATFPGGKLKLEEYLKDNMLWRQSQLTTVGKVFVSFKIDIEGSVSDVKIIRGLCETCDNEAIRLVEEMPNWNPAKKNGINIPSKKIIMIKFEL